MREPLRDKERLEHIATAADNIARYTKGKTYDDLLADDMMCYARCQRDRFLSRLTNSRKAAFSAPNTENQEVKLIFPALKPAPKPAPIPAHRLKPPLYS